MTHLFRTFREHHILVIIATNLTQSTIGGIVKNINNLNKGQFKMNEYQKAILKRIDMFLKMFSNLLIILTNESSFKSKTNKEINVVVPKINEVVKTINKNIYDN